MRRAGRLRSLRSWMVTFWVAATWARIARMLWPSVTQRTRATSSVPRTKIVPAMRNLSDISSSPHCHGTHPGLEPANLVEVLVAGLDQARPAGLLQDRPARVGIG